MATKTTPPHPKLPDPAQARQAALAEAVRQARRDLAGRAEKRADFNALGNSEAATASADFGRARPIGEAIERLERAALGKPLIRHGKVWAQDLRPLPPLADRNGFLAACRRRLAATRRPGDPWTNTAMAVLQVLSGALHAPGRGYTRASYRAIARRSSVCPETARRVIRWAEAVGLVDVLNVMERAWIDGTRRIVRAANLYIMRWRGKPAVEAADSPPGVPPGRAAPSPLVEAALGRLAAAWGMTPTPLGLRRRPPD